MIGFMKWVLARMPAWFQQELKRYYYAFQIKIGKFRTAEPEFEKLTQWLSDGDWAIDVGANIGHYSVRMSQLVGAKGRILALEPVPHTFELLSANVSRVGLHNVTLLNMAASDESRVVGISIPTFSTGLRNNYQARISTENAEFEVLCVSIDQLEFQNPVKLVKIDAEGHDFEVLKGMKDILDKFHPVVIIESGEADVIEFMDQFGYSHNRNSGSPNTIFQHDK